MKADGLLKHAGLVLGIALALYVVAYSGIEYQRTHKGPWQVTFTQAGAHPALLINQPALAVTNVLITFPEASAHPMAESAIWRFSQPRPVPCEVPYGKCIFMDMTSLPGTVVFELFGHEIQLMPRVLTIDKQERAWNSNEVIDLPGKNSLPPAVLR